VLCHDITKIVPDEYKGPAFSKGHVICTEDIPELLKLGKEHIYVWEMNPDMVHENDAAIRIAQALQGKGLILSEPKEGKVNLIAATRGMCIINETLLMEINMIEEVVVATRNNRKPANAGDIIAGIRVVPLVIDEQKLVMVEKLSAGREVIQVNSFITYRVGIVTTGSEVYYGRIKDKFGPLVKKKMEAYGCNVIRQILVTDDTEEISSAIHALIDEGAEIVLITGGMSVDPDDVTPRAVKEAGADIVTYGAPVLPGAMLMVAYLGDVPVLGLPGCVMYSKATIFDLILPTILTGERITRSMVAKLGLGGLCLNCEVCHYPACSFGTGA
jgi:molybdenum cofactor synthesis domain-containing protein